MKRNDWMKRLNVNECRGLFDTNLVFHRAFMMLFSRATHPPN